MIESFSELYYADSYRRHFTARVVAARVRQGQTELRLDQTCFYPEGGGQPGDRGLLRKAAEADLTGDGPAAASALVPGAEAAAAAGASYSVVDTQIDHEGVIWHLLDQPISWEPGTRLYGEIDWLRRYDLMQQHSAEHLVSGVTHRRFGYDNVGFHIGQDLTTLDFNGPLAPAELLWIEDQVNQAVWQNLPYDISYPDRQQLPSISYRSKLELDGAVRLVTVPGYDCCACCGTQVRRTGELGLIKLCDAESYKGGMRLTMLAGRRALREVQRWQQQLDLAASGLSRPRTDLAEGIRLLQQELRQQRALVRQGEDRWLEHCLARLPESSTTEPALILFRDCNSRQLKEAARKLWAITAGRPQAASLLLLASGSAAPGDAAPAPLTFYLLQQSSAPEDLWQQLKACCPVKGGGRAPLYSGRLTATEAQLPRLAAQLKQQYICLP
ncbi:alanyl-tRNA editing protein [Oscillospiraceae bacterium HV4-5-C5C]|nr:alanyl-tRNA editing protein [Oscillospiraceae bacterium HV4-5-C5C]